jgi:pimeloyl-ACP methyl ester carboxylesterase
MVGSEVLTPEGIKVYFHPAKKKKYKERVVMIHHMGGNHKTTWRHFRHLNDKGFDCVSFDLLLGSGTKNVHWNPLLKKIYKGVFYVWTNQIRSVLNHIEGDKIIYAFSGPSLSAFWAAHGRKDIKKFICDGGPFHDIYENTKNFFREEAGIHQKQINAVSAYLGTTVWGFKPLDKLHRVLRLWPSNIPILSIRGVEDNIVNIDSIREVFEPHPQLDLQTLELRHGKHLDGIRDFPVEYNQVLLPFIKHKLENILEK